MHRPPRLPAPPASQHASSSLRPRSKGPVCTQKSVCRQGRSKAFTRTMLRRQHCTLECERGDAEMPDATRLLLQPRTQPLNTCVCVCRYGALPFPKLTLAWDSQANRVFSLGEILPSSKPRQPGEKPRKASCKSAWGGAWGRGELGGDVMAEMSPHAAAGSATPSNGTSADNTFDVWLARVKAARPELTPRVPSHWAIRRGLEGR